jgi:cytochrome c peroxidase
MEADNQQASAENAGISLNLAQDEQCAIIAFLHTLTDRDFVTDERFSNPFDEDE